MAKILLSVYPEYTKAIFSGMKTAEFRRKVVNELLEGGSHTLYFYETKKNGGAGKVVGQADVKEVFVTLHAEYLTSGLPQLDGLSVEKMQQMYITWCRQKEKPPVGWWYSDRDFTAYCKLIGWNGDPKHYYNYVLKLENVQKYDTPLDVSCFTYESGKTITRPPQNMCKCMPDFAAAKIRSDKHMQRKEAKIMETKYKINIHILEACNFSCRQCFSKFGTKKLLPVEDWKKIIDNCIAGADVTEFNIAGGEPMLYPGLVELVKYIRDKGVKVSLITNGSLMNEEWIKNYAGMYETIGFSVDSINDETNRKIGRCDRNGKTIPAGRIVELCGLIRKYAPGCRIKINTVVSALNKDEVMSDFIDEIAADRWKILRMKPFQYGSFSNLDIQVSDEEFERFVERNREKNKEKMEKQEEKEDGKEVRAGAKAGTETARREIVVEPDMKASYVLIDSNGCLLDNAVDEMTPVAVCDCLREDFADGLRRLTLDRERYEARYSDSLS